MNRPSLNGNSSRLVKYWPIALFVLAFASATGAQQVVIGNNSKAIASQINANRESDKRVQKELRRQAETNGRIDERTKLIQEQLRDILKELRQRR